MGPLEAGEGREREAPLFCAGCNRGYMGIRNRQRDFLLNYVGGVQPWKKEHEDVWRFIPFPFAIWQILKTANSI